MTTSELINHRIIQLHRDIEMTWKKYRSLHSELDELIKEQRNMTESSSKDQLLTEQVLYLM